MTINKFYITKNCSCIICGALIGAIVIGEVSSSICEKCKDVDQPHTHSEQFPAIPMGHFTIAGLTIVSTTT